MNHQALEQTARAMVAANRGILAADESNATIEKRFKGPGIPCTEENRRGYRELMFATPEMEKYISGVIMYDETLRQKTKDGIPFPAYLAAKGVVPGIKVDKGPKELVNFDGETITEGLDGLRERLAEYHALGARFAKWRAVITIGKSARPDSKSWLLPTKFAIDANAHALARYAALCQEAGIVPIVEPEVLMDGDNDLARCEEVTDAVLESVFEALGAHRIHLEGIVLKPNMVISGLKAPRQATVDEVAVATIRCLKRHVPGAVPGIAFLSGGQSSELATAHLSAMNKLGPLPWHLTFSYGRALQDGAIKGWKGESANVGLAQAWFKHRAVMNSKACAGAYSAEMERAAAA
jgi:fructose-bisphosphate aldolase class I